MHVTEKKLSMGFHPLVDGIENVQVTMFLTHWMGGKEPPPALQQHNSWVLNIFSDSLTDRCIALLRQIQKLGEKERIDS